MKRNIEQFFNYKWQFDRNQAIDDEEEMAILEQLPEEVQNKIYTNFLFKEFLHIFQDYVETTGNIVKKFCMDVSCNLTHRMPMFLYLTFIEGASYTVRTEQF